VAFITAAIVAPAGDCSIASTRDCFEPELTFSGLASPAVRLDGSADGADDADFAGDRFFADFDIEILRSVDDGLAPHHRSPTSAIKPAGQDLRAPQAPGISDSNAPFAADCQSFLGVLRQFTLADLLPAGDRFDSDCVIGT
jgi:hypothetical protein